MATIWRTENFSRGLHTKSARVEGGEAYAADIENLQVDADGFLRLRANIGTVGPMANTETITGVAATASHLFLLRADGTLYVRPVDDLETEERIHGAENLEGRISVVAPASTYVILTSEGMDQGYWIDLREGKPRLVNPLGLEPPASDALEVVQTVPPLDKNYTSFVVYAFTYIREFEAGSGKVQPDELFNGMESELSAVKYIFTRRDEAGIRRNFGVDGEEIPAWNWTTDSFVAPGEGGRDGDTLLISVVDNQGRNFRRQMLDALPRLVGGFLSLSRGIPINPDIGGIISAVPEAIDTHLRLTLTDRIGSDFSDGSEFFVDIASALNLADSEFDLEENQYYPALIKGFSFSDADAQVTGINIYRSRIFRDDDDYTRLQKLIDDNAPDLDLNTLEFRKIRTISRTSFPYTVLDGENAASKPYIQILNQAGGKSRSAETYVWMEQERFEIGSNERLPAEVKQIHYHRDRIFAPVGDRLIYSAYSGTIAQYWHFPKDHFQVRSDNGRIDFCASHREVLLIGASDGLFRLEGQDEFDFELDQISGAGPLDGYSWGALENTLGFIGSKGLYVTDAATVEFVGDESLDGFFNAKTVVHGSVAFFVDNTILFFVGLQTIGETEITDNLFLFDDRYWVRWSGETITQFASIEGQIYVAAGAVLRKVQLDEGENTDADLPWAWESNLIHGQEQGVGNITKRFTELLLSAAGGTRITLKTWVDVQQNPTQQEITTRDDLYFQRIPIERIGKRLRFRLEGKGPVEIRGLQIEGEV